MAFRVGQKVVCVDDRSGEVTGQRLLVRGSIYTIRGFDFWERGTGLYLEELTAGIHVALRWLGEEISFSASRFRPLVSKSTDTGFSVLEDIRKRKSVPADERVRDSVTAGKPGDAA